MPSFDPTARPDEASVKRQYDYLQGVWAAAHATMAEIDSLYFGLNDIWRDLAPEFKSTRWNFHSMRAQALVDHAVDAHLAFEPRFHREPVGEGEEHKRKADRVERGLGALIRDAFLAGVNFPPKVNGKQLVRHNYTQLYVGLDSDRLRKPTLKRGEDKEDFERRLWEWETRHGSWNPIVLEVPEPGTVLMDPARKMPSIAIRRKKLFAYDLYDLVTTKLARRTAEGEGYVLSKEPYDEVEIIEWWSPHWLAVGDGERLFYTEKNNWGFQPFGHTFGGTADMAMQKDFDVDWWVRQSLLWRVKDLLIMEDQTMAGQHALLQRAAYARPITSLPPEQLAGQMKGAILGGEGVTRDDIWIEAVPDLPTQTFEHGRQVREAIEQGTFALQAAGFRQTGVDTATQQVILSEATNRTFKAAVKQMEELYAIGGSNVLKLKHAASRLYGVDIGDGGSAPFTIADIEDRFYVSVSFEQVDAVVAEQEKASARQDLQLGLLDRESYWRIARVEDVTAVKEGILRDLVDSHPDVIAEDVKRMMIEMGFGELAARKEQEERMAAMVRPDGTPLFPGRAPASRVP